MDEEGTKVIDKWLCEFVLRHQKNPRIIMRKLSSTLRLEEDDDCSTLKKLAVLHDIWNQLIHGTVDEQLLDLLEMFEKILLLEGSAILQSLKSSYCWVAAECTIRYMLPMSNMEEFHYLDALKRIWDLRIRVLKEKESDLLTQELIDWGDNFKNAIEDPQLYQRLSETNAKYTAISHLCKFVKEHWELMGYSSHELVVQRRFQSKGNNANVEGDNGSSRDTLVDAQKGEKEVRPDGAEKHLEEDVVTKHPTIIYTKEETNPQKDKIKNKTRLQEGSRSGIKLQGTRLQYRSLQETKRFKHKDWLVCYKYCVGWVK